MLSEHLTARQIQDFNQRSASPPELLGAMNHIALCEACREQLSSEEKTRASVESLRTDLRRQAQSSHVTYEELAGCVDDALSQTDREAIESHLEICSHCAAELADLRAFKAEMTTYPEIERRPAGSPTLRGKIIAFFRAPSYRIPVQLAAAATVVLLCVSIAALLLRKETADLQPEVSELQHQDVAPQAPQAPPAPEPSPNPAAPAAEIAEAMHDGGGVVAMDKEGNVTGLESLPPGYQREVKAALTNRRVEMPSEMQGLIGRTGGLMGSADSGPGFSLIGPVGTIVRADRPGFRWKALNGATSYVVGVFDSSFNKVASSQAQPGTEWSPVNSLKRGETYSWQVTAMKDGKEVVSPAPPAPAAKFKVLDFVNARELEQVKRIQHGSHLVLGILYQRAGLLDDAEREFNTLYRANPNSELVKKLLRDVRLLRK